MSSAIDKQKFLRQQAIILDHARICDVPCKLPYCNIMKDVIEHLKKCQEMTACSTPRCTSVRKILQHKEKCTRAVCPICGTNEQNAQNHEFLDQSLNTSQFNVTNTSVNMGTDIMETSMCPDDSIAANDSLANISVAESPVRHTYRPISNSKEHVDLNISQLAVNTAAMNLIQDTPAKMVSFIIVLSTLTTILHFSFNSIQSSIKQNFTKNSIKFSN